MGSCISVIRGNDKIEKVKRIEVIGKKTGASQRRKNKKTRRREDAKKIKKTETRENNDETGRKEGVEKTPVSEIHGINCPPHTAWRIQSRSKQAAGKNAKKCSSLEVIDVEDEDESTLEDEHQFLVENNSDANYRPMEDYKIGGVSRPRNDRVLVKQNDAKTGACAVAHQRESSSSTRKKHLQRRVGRENETSNLSTEPSRSSAHPRKTKVSGALPRPSQWHQVYTEKLKNKEKRAHENLKKEPKKKAKKALTRAERDHAYKVSLIKRIKKSIMKDSRAQGPDTAYYLAATDEYFARIFGINVEDLEGGSSSSSSESSRSSIGTTSSDGDLNEQSIGRFYKGDESDQRQKHERRSRGWFGWRSNKVVPL